ncbi:unnamed protein product [Hyaloperonospora brassicae]|uniref:Uncharacterized protein n=1 Tax=Hyaloperonospora brassicae TaxID=162125 RepID=A0AAV0T062_HYABA|nr:unnamed protein product [Hyaloperonospora brassicae]
MFWRRSRPKEAAVGETDDLAQLQKQFGITVVSDADVAAELLALSFLSGASSLTDEERLVLGSDSEDEDEEAEIMRALEMDDEMPCDVNGDPVGRRVEKKELCSVMDEVCKTARERNSREATDTTQEATRGHTAALVSNDDAKLKSLKVEAVMLKREGKIEQALAKLREANQLQQKIAAEEDQTSETKQEEVQCEDLPLEESMSNDDIEVTDEDMQNPEFLAQLAEMGLTSDTGISTDERTAHHSDVSQTLAALETQIHACKMKAVRLKRENRIADALACMREIKELEANYKALQSSQLLSTAAPSAVQKREILGDMGQVESSASVNSFPVLRVDSETVTLDEVHPGSSNDSMDDAKVTSLSKSQATCMAEALPSEVKDASASKPLLTESHMLQEDMVIRTAVADARCLRTAPSIDDNYLIDAFDEKYECEATNHLTSVTSGNPLRSAPFVPGGKSITLSAEYTRTVSSGRHPDGSPAQLQQARQTALLPKRKGDIQGALEAMRRAKQIQDVIDHKQQASLEIEQLLVDFGNKATSLAKGCLPANRNMASEWLSKRKRYESELEKLRLKRQNPLQPPPRYEVVKMSREVEFELPFVAEDQIRVSIKSVNGLSQAAGKSVFVKFCLNFPSGKSHEGQTAEFRISSKASFSADVCSDQKCFVFRLARSRGTMRLFGIKKAVFEVWSLATLFRNSELVARAYQELTPLLTCCEINTHIPFLGRSRKPCGGDIEIVLQVRRPLKEKEVRLETVEDLVIGDYPDPVTPVPERVPVPSLVVKQSPVGASGPIAKGLERTTDHRSTLPQRQPNPASIPVDDPHHLDLIVSYDVIDEELDRVGAKLPSSSERNAVEWGDRCDSLVLKKQLLEIEMQTGKLTLDAYVGRLRSRISDDRILIAELLALNRRSDAARVLRRIKIMQKEIEGTEDSSDDT